MKMLGHPIHVLLIHFPTALLPMDLVLSLIGFFTHQTEFTSAAYYSLIAGVISGWLALIFGLIDLLKIKSYEKKILDTALLHGSINGTIILIFSVLAYKSWQQYPSLPIASLAILIIKGILILTLFIGNYLGGSLIYKYHVGIQIEK